MKRTKMPRLGVHRLAHHNGTGYDNVQRCSRERSVFSHYLVLAVLNAMIAENVMSVERVLAREKKIATPPVSHRTDGTERKLETGNSYIKIRPDKH